MRCVSAAYVVIRCPSVPLAGFKGPTSKGREGKERGTGRGRKGSGNRKGEGGIKGKGGEGKGVQGWERKFRGQGMGKIRGRENGRGGKI